jgi:uncharacterized membrane protein YgcG
MVYDGWLSLDGDEGSCFFTLLDLELEITQSTDNFGVPRGIPRCSQFKVTLRGQTAAADESKLVEWMLSPNMKKNGNINFSTIERSGATEGANMNVKFIDTYCTKYSIRYNTEILRGASRDQNTELSQDPYSILLVLTPLSLEFANQEVLNSVVFTGGSAGAESGSGSGSSSGSGGGESASSGGEVSSFRAD